MTLSRKGAKSRTRSRKLRSTGTKARTRGSRMQRHLVDPETERRFRLLPAERDFLKFALATDRDGRLLFP